MKPRLVFLLVAFAACAKPKTAPDPREGLKAGMYDAAQAASGLKLTNNTLPPAPFKSGVNADLAFSGKYAIQGNFAGLLIWDVSNPNAPVLVTSYPCPASQNDVSVFRNLVFMSSEGNSSRLDCASGGVPTSVSNIRMRGVRIFDISDIKAPKLVASVQTCRGSHTHTLVEDPKDKDNVYIYISGSAGLRSPEELAGCTKDAPDASTSALWRIEIIKVPLAHPEQAAVVNRANIFSGLKMNAEHGEAPEDIADAKHEADSARAKGGFVAKINGVDAVFTYRTLTPLLDSIVKARGGTGVPTRSDTEALRPGFQAIVDKRFGTGSAAPKPGVDPISVNTQCHDITVYPSIGLAGGACEGHGMLLDIHDVTNPKRLDAVADSNFSYWHSATFNNDGTKILFSDEWGGGGAPKCRASDKKEWGADAIFDIVDGKLKFRSYYKMPAVQTNKEVCVAHNGSLVPIPGRDIMVQSWYEGGVSMFDWSDAAHPKEIAYFDRGPMDSTRLVGGGTWSVYWYNGAIVSSEILRGLDVMQMVPSQYVTQNEIDAANTVKMTYFNAQDQPKLSWPPSFPLAKAYVDQLERNKCLPKSRIAAVRASISSAEAATGAQRQSTLTTLATELGNDAKGSCDSPKVMKLQQAVSDLSHPMVP